jgi:apolipoprotein N-acyltransferase
LNWSEESVYQSLDQLREQSKDLWKNNWVIWPEAAIPTALTFHSALPFLEEMNSLASENQAALFTGVIYDDEEKNKYYNSIVGLGSGYGFYHKRRLVPFGEYVPLENQLRGLIEFFNLPTSFIHLGPQEQHGLIAKGIRISPAICYEIVYPDLIAESAKETQVLLNINNLGWFLDSIQSKQFMQMAQMRALETGRYLIYNTNNGPSAIINNKGKIIVQSQAFKADTLSGIIYPVKDWTPFMIIGSWPLALILSLVLLLIWGIGRIKTGSQFKNT